LQGMRATMDDQRFSETTSAKGEGLATGCLAGAMTSGCLIVAGGLLCLTGIGAIIGIPMILGGLLAPFLGPVLGLTNIKGKCPYCETNVTAQSRALGVTCPACKKRIVIREKRFYGID
jgi:DNA-directed RNA polymerase subunit RPC12/RpoP